MCFTTSFLSVTWLAEQGSKAEKGKEHLFLPLHGAQPAVGCWHPPLRPDAVPPLLCWVGLEKPLAGWRPRELLHPRAPLTQLPPRPNPALP